MMTRAERAKIFAPFDAMKGLQEALRDAPIKIPTMQYPLIQRTGTNGAGKQITYYLNYSGEACAFTYDGADGTELISGEKLTAGQTFTIGAWDLRIVETDVQV